MTPRDPQTQEIQAILKGLVRAADESEFAYMEARKTETNEDLRALYDQYAEERARFKHELEFRIRRLGALTHENEDQLDEDPEPLPHHDANGDPVSAEDTSLMWYGKTLELDLPYELYALVEHQAKAVEEAKEHIARLKGLRTEAPTEGNSDTPDSVVPPLDEGSDLAEDIRPDKPTV